MRRVEYFGDPLRPIGFNHTGLSNQLIEKQFMEFEDDIQAYEFLLECDEPITKVEDIFVKGRVPSGILKRKELSFRDNMDDLDDSYDLNSLY